MIRKNAIEVGQGLENETRCMWELQGLYCT